MNQKIWTVVACAIVGLSGWTLKKISEISVDVAKVEADEAWIKTILTELSRKTK